MKNNPVFEAVQSSLSRGDTGEALQLLVSFLENEPEQAETLRIVRLVEANYQSVRQQEIKGILPFAEAQREYARANDAILKLLDDLKAGRKPTMSKSRDVRRSWLIGGALLLVIGIGAGIWFSSAPAAALESKTKESKAQCPGFRPTGFKVMVLEFQKLSGDNSNPALGIQSRIRDLTAKNNVDTDVQILTEDQFGRQTPDIPEAVGIGKNCQADMIIWGQYEKGDTSLEVDIRYTFTNPDWPPGAAQDKFKNVSEIKSDRMKITHLDDAVFRLCTAMALHENQVALAEKWLNKIKQPNARERQWKQMVNE